MSVRLTLQTRLVLGQALSEPGREWYGAEMVEATGLPEGTVYPMLARLERAGWLAVRVEKPGERGGERRAARRYLRLTGRGQDAARAALAGLPTARTIPAPWPIPVSELEVAQ